MATTDNRVETVVADAEKFLAHAPFGACLLDEHERVLWTNSTLREQLGLDTAGDDKLGFDDLPIKIHRESGLCQPSNHPGTRLRLVITPLDKKVKIASFTDVTDLTTGAAAYIEILQQMAGTDSVTGLRTRAQINRDLIAEIARSRRYGNKLSITRIAITNGALAALPDDQRTNLQRNVGVRLADNLRAIDCAGMWSDTEFLLILPETGADAAERLVDKISAVLSEVDGHVLDIQCGIAEWRASDDVTTLLDRAAPH